jgi:hypothetical protein
MAEKADDQIHQAEGQFDTSWREEQWGSRRLSIAAQDIASDEKSMTIWQAVRNNPAAICWSLTISTCVIMEGYDTALLGNFWAYPSFQRKFGDFVHNEWLARYSIWSTESPYRLSHGPLSLPSHHLLCPQ